MSAVFKNGKNLSPNTEQALKYVAKVGVMTKCPAFLLIGLLTRVFKG